MMAFVEIGLYDRVFNNECLHGRPSSYNPVSLLEEETDCITGAFAAVAGAMSDEGASYLVLNAGRTYPIYIPVDDDTFKKMQYG
jgi:hypothetical protein